MLSRKPDGYTPVGLPYAKSVRQQSARQRDDSKWFFYLLFLISGTALAVLRARRTQEFSGGRAGARTKTSVIAQQ
jgi:hypothetical protein